MRVFIPVLLLAAMPAALFAQWDNYPARDVPRTPDGKPNLAGPVPKAADGHPDMTGLWEYYRDRAGRGGPPPAAPPPDASLGLGVVAPGSNPFFNIGFGMKDGLPFQPWALALRKSRMAENNKDNPDAHCLPIGLMQLHQHPQPRKIIQTRDVIAILYEAQGGVRQIIESQIT